jgi:hypothetical protein
MNIPAGAGAEHLKFQIGGILGDKHAIGTWNLNITTALVDQTGKLVEDSANSISFAVQLTPAILTVVVPASVAVSVDGMKQPTGPTQVPVVVGDHNITVPTFAQVDASTRVRFDHWPDGSTNPNTTLFVGNDTNIEVAYVTQYLLTVAGPQLTSTGAGWYDADATATFSVASTEPMNDPLGALGGKLRFQSWYEDGKLLTDQTSGSITMHQPHTVTAVWQADYSQPATIIVGIMIIAFAIAYLLVRKAKVQSRKRRRRRNT